MVSHRESPCSWRVAATHSHIIFVNAITSHGVSVEREEGVKVDRCKRKGVDKRAYIAPPAVVRATTVTEPEA